MHLTRLSTMLLLASSISLAYSCKKKDNPSPKVPEVGPGFAATYRNGNDTLHLFAKNHEGKLLHRYWSKTGGWTGWQDLGGRITSEPAVVSRSASSINVFAKGNNNNLVHIRWVRDEGWSNWTDLEGNITSAPSVASGRPDKMEVYALGNNGQLQSRTYWGDEKVGHFLPWEDHGGKFADAPAAVYHGIDTVHIFGRSVDNKLIHRTRITGQPWSNTEVVGGNIQGAPVAVVRGLRTIQVFVKGAANNLQIIEWNNYGYAYLPWSTWGDLGGDFRSIPAAVSKQASHIEVFAGDANGTIQQANWIEASNTWSPWAPLH
ncbi:hypothetical protein ACQKLP_16265 [Chitinophaga sp. NPDC101104]|uniref:hypothetical protein n=1 Tax=Chitinophaga sp. NPDC101104 TaxID=3390561 RepID=UPI003CFE6BA7